jgi:hypothetical protein
LRDTSTRIESTCQPHNLRPRPLPGARFTGAQILSEWLNCLCGECSVGSRRDRAPRAAVTPDAHRTGCQRRTRHRCAVCRWRRSNDPEASAFRMSHAYRRTYLSRRQSDSLMYCSDSTDAYIRCCAISESWS